MTRARMLATVAWGALTVASCGRPTPSSDSQLNLRSVGSVPVSVLFRGARITLPPGGELAGLIYEKGDAVEALRGSDVNGVTLASRTLLDHGPVYVVLSPDESGNVGIASSNRPITIVEKR